MYSIFEAKMHTSSMVEECLWSQEFSGINYFGAISEICFSV